MTTKTIRTSIEYLGLRGGKTIRIEAELTISSDLYFDDRSGVYAKAAGKLADELAPEAAGKKSAGIFSHKPIVSNEAEARAAYRRLRRIDGQLVASNGIRVL